MLVHSCIWAFVAETEMESDRHRWEFDSETLRVRVRVRVRAGRSLACPPLPDPRRIPTPPPQAGVRIGGKFPPGVLREQQGEGG
jgi:hypothetical protein